MGCGPATPCGKWSPSIWTISQHWGWSNRDKQLKHQSEWSSAIKMWRKNCQEIKAYFRTHHIKSYFIKRLWISFIEPFSWRWNVVFSHKRAPCWKSYLKAGLHGRSWPACFRGKTHVDTSIGQGLYTLLFFLSIQKTLMVGLEACTLTFPTALGLGHKYFWVNKKWSMLPCSRHT